VQDLGLRPAAILLKADTLPLWLAAGLYLWQAWNYQITGQYGMGLGFVAYAIANVGFILAARGI
jgi:hypothetical protein